MSVGDVRGINNVDESESQNEDDRSFYSFNNSDFDSNIYDDSNDDGGSNEEDNVYDNTTAKMPEKAQHLAARGTGAGSISVEQAESQGVVAQQTPTRAMPAVKDFDLAPKLNLRDISSQVEAQQKLASTQIWLDSQQPKPSLLSKFNSALKAYFAEDKPAQFQQRSLEEENHIFNIKQVVELQNVNDPIVEPSKPEEPYVSPLPTIVETIPPHFPLKKPPIMVPAGYDLMNLVKYKNSNHRARRPTSRLLQAAKSQVQQRKS